VSGTRSSAHRFRYAPSRWARVAAALIGMIALTLIPFAQTARAEDPPALPAILNAIHITAEMGFDWQEPHQTSHVWLLRGNCRLQQGDTKLEARQMVIWTDRTADDPPQERVTVYLEDNVRMEWPGGTRTAQVSMVELSTSEEVSFRIARPLSGRNAQGDPIFVRACEYRRAHRKPIRRTQFVLPGDNAAGPELKSLPVQPPVGGMRRLRVFQRSAVPYNVFSFESNDTTPPEQVWILSGGVTILIDGLDDERFATLVPGGVGTVSLSADRIVIWTQSAASKDFTSETIQSRETPLQIYLEGNIVARQGDHVLRADRAYYDAREDRALVLKAELKVNSPELPFSLRVRSEKLRQLSKSSFHAEQAWVSTSRFGKPGYRLQSTDVFLEERPPRSFFSSEPTAVNPETGLPEVETVPWATSMNSTLLVDDVPLFYWPYASTPLEDPGTPLRRVSVENDRIFGVQARTVWDLYKVFGMETPPGSRLDLNLDYLSDRGPGVGLDGAYSGVDMFGLPGVYKGSGLGYYIHDDGTDNLGLDRRSLAPNDPNRGRVLWRHRQNIFEDLTLQAELGWISDRNFLEQYYEEEFDTGKDNETLIYGKYEHDNFAISALGKAQVNDFDTTTGWLPRGDLYVLSEPLFDGWMNWSTHSSAGYGHLNPAVAPTDPTDLFSPLPYVTDAEGAVLMTRHELNAPFQLGPVNVVPYALGEAAYWSEDLNGNELGRLYGSAGVRASILFWKVFPNVQSDILGLRGLAHKMTFDADYSISESSADLADIPQYNEFDDTAQLRFRNRLLVNTFGGMLPSPFDPRSYAVRSGAAHNVTAPYHELVDDQHVLRLGWRHRLQTKTGPLHNQRTVDWMTLDLEGSFYPNEDRDNFGQPFGLLGARYNWNLSERTTFVASALYDTFDGAHQQLWDVGLISQRSTRGSVYLGVRQVKGGALDSQILTASYSYAMSPKWISTFGTAYDLGENENRGQSLTVTRVGADFLLHFGANFDASKNNVGVAFMIEPRFFNLRNSSAQLGSLLGGY